MVNSFCFLSGVSGSECIRVMQYLNVAILCSVGWFGKKLMVVCVDGFSEYVNFDLRWFRIGSRCKEFVCPLASCVGLNFMSLCVWFILAVIRFGCFCLESYIIKISSM